MANRWGRGNGNSGRFYSWTPKSWQTVTAAMKLKDACSLYESYDKSRQCIKKQRHHFANKVSYTQSYDFSSGHVWMWELDHKEDWALKNWCFWTVVSLKTLESPLDSKEINPEYSLEGLMLKLKLQYSGHLMLRSDWLIGKDSEARKNWRQEEKRMTQDEMVRWHHWLSGHEFEHILGDDEGQGGLVFYSLWGCIESDTT